jgi:phage N-6-adenine-methyltransferase
MTSVARRSRKADVTRYDPEAGLKSIAVFESAAKHFRRAKDASQLFKAVAAKIDAEADYVVWRDGVVVPSQKTGGPKDGRTRGRIAVPKSALPDADPGHLVAHRWRRRFTKKVDGETKKDADKIKLAKDDANHRCVRVCEQEKAGTVRGTEGTGEFERYTPAQYLEAARLVLGAIDLDPATSEEAQRVVRAEAYFTEADDGLQRDWDGRVWLNPPYHRELAPKFIDKLIAEIAAGRVSAAIMLTNNCTDTEWFLRAARKADAICFTNGRINFTRPNGGEPVLPTQGQAFFISAMTLAALPRCFAASGGALPGLSIFGSRRRDHPVPERLL